MCWVCAQWSSLQSLTVPFTTVLERSGLSSKISFTFSSIRRPASTFYAIQITTMHSKPTKSWMLAMSWSQRRKLNSISRLSSTALLQVSKIDVRKISKLLVRQFILHVGLWKDIRVRSSLLMIFRQRSRFSLRITLKSLWRAMLSQAFKMTRVRCGSKTQAPCKFRSMRQPRVSLWMQT